MKIRKSILYLLLYVCLGTVLSQNYTHHIVLDSDDIFHMYWNPPEDKRGDSEISIKVEVKAKGYFGFGFSPDGEIPGSDIVCGWIKDGEVYFQDRHALANEQLIVDPEQDYELIDGYENYTFTVFEFHRKLETCDENDMEINESTMRVIYAYSEQDPESDDTFYHLDNRGWKSVLLLQNKADEDPGLNFNALSYWDVRSPYFDISSLDTMYWCKIVRSPEMSNKHHVVLIKPLIQEGHEEFVHHIVLHICVGGTPDEYEPFVASTGYECYNDHTPIEMKRCEGNIITWAIGGGDIVLPDHVGLPLDPASVKYYMLEVHYDNPELQKGIIDHSGLRLYYTSNLRKFDGSDFRVGASFIPRVFIPPAQDEYIVVGHSSTELFGTEFPEGRVKAFAVLLHTHLLGRAIKLRHFRGNKELIPLANDENFDFHYQEYRYYNEEIEILSGDQVTVECTFSSSERTNVTFGGLSTREEMCVVHLIYYPAVSQYSSHSSPTYANINKVLKTNVTDEAHLQRELENYNWANIDINEVENAMMYSEHETQSSPLTFQKDKEYIMTSYPKGLIPYERVSTCNMTM